MATTKKRKVVPKTSPWLHRPSKEDWVAAGYIPYVCHQILVRYIQLPKEATSIRFVRVRDSGPDVFEIVTNDLDSIKIDGRPYAVGIYGEFFDWLFPGVYHGQGSLLDKEHKTKVVVEWK